MSAQKVPYWQRPYPFDTSWREVAVNWLFSGAFVFLFLALFRPLGLRAEGWVLYRICFFFALATMIPIALVDTSLVLLSNRLSEGWTLGKEWGKSALIVVGIAVANMFLAALLYGSEPSVMSFLNWLKLTFAVGLFPMAVGAYLKENKLRKLYSQHEAEKPHPPIENPLSDVVLEGDNQNERLVLSLASLICIESADNYVKVWFWKEQRLQSQLLRSTLKKVEDALARQEGMYRCHRRFIVNLFQVQRIEGNAQGYKLAMKNTDMSIPVSRSLSDEIVRKLVLSPQS